MRSLNVRFLRFDKIPIMSRYRQFDREQIRLKSVFERGHDLRAGDCMPLEPIEEAIGDPEFDKLVEKIAVARSLRRPVILMIGGHPIKLGLSRYLVSLIESGWVTHLATNGSGMIHDFELAAFGGTSESVAKWIRHGQFGLWQETSQLNDIVREAAERQEGLGEAIGRTLEEDRFPHRELSLAAAGWRCNVPVTCHVSIGSDIIHAHPNCDGRSLGQSSYTDFLIFSESVSQLEGGVFLNIGSAVTGPEVYLKSLSMARNVARQRGECITDITTAVFDLVELPPSYRNGPPGKSHAMYYYRPWKTILVRTVADGGTSYYFQADHRRTIPSLWESLVRRTTNEAFAKRRAS